MHIFVVYLRIHLTKSSVMLIEFSVGNYLSIKDKKTLSLEASSITEHKGNLFKVAKYNLLRSAVLYGANSSGKSNFLKAMSTMRRIVLRSGKLASTDTLDVIPFLLNTQTTKEPSFFEVLFLIDEKRFRYGFEVNDTQIKTEWLFQMDGTKEIPLFIREGQAIEIMACFSEAKGLEIKTRSNALFLAIIDQFNGPTAEQILRWFNNWATISGLMHDNYRGITLEMLETEESRLMLKDFYVNLDLGFQDLNLILTDLTTDKLVSKKFPEEVIKQIIAQFKGEAIKFGEIETIHKVFDNKGDVISTKRFDLDQQESAGTNKIIDISGAIFRTLKNGGVIVVDELDTKLHPLLTLAIIQLFNSTESNKKNAQLIFATHDTNLLSHGCFRRDQIYFTEKDKFEATDLYSLVEYKENGTKIRKDRSFEKDYIDGRYGAIPYLGDYLTMSR